mmetsp:Transcript_60332/g.171429  ORF Transcript_60332/g.171429 Transcript_60332/m.171429 type:complete len:202 (-) Transcript_60332:531-1136(-)
MVTNLEPRPATPRGAAEDRLAPRQHLAVEHVACALGAPVADAGAVGAQATVVRHPQLLGGGRGQSAGARGHRRGGRAAGGERSAAEAAPPPALHPLQQLRRMPGAGEVGADHAGRVTVVRKRPRRGGGEAAGAAGPAALPLPLPLEPPRQVRGVRPGRQVRGRQLRPGRAGGGGGPRRCLGAPPAQLLREAGEWVEQTEGG